MLSLETFSLTSRTSSTANPVLPFGSNDNTIVATTQAGCAAKPNYLYQKDNQSHEVGSAITILFPY